MHRPLALILLGQSSPPASSLPPQAQVRVLVIILGVAALALLALLVMTVLRRILRRPGLERPTRESASGAARGLSPWEQAGRRAAPVSDGPREDADGADKPGTEP